MNRARTYKKRCHLCREPDDFLISSKNRKNRRSHVCEDCLQRLFQAYSKTEPNDSFDVLNNIPSPKDIVSFLDQYVIGQDEAKRSLALAVTNHIKRISCLNDENFPSDLKDTLIEKSNIFLIGDSGTGKTILAQSLAKFVNLPFAITDATTVTQAGYVGEDVENLLLRLVVAADYDIKYAEYGILFIDEVDKLGQKSNNSSLTRDVSGEGVQQSLLKILEGTVSNIPPNGGRKHPEQEYLQLDTSNILFICGGAFVGLDDIVNKRINKKNSIGFSNSDLSRYKEENWMNHVKHEDLNKYGFIPEFVGRIPVITHTNSLSVEDLSVILKQPKNSLVNQYRKLAYLDGVDLKFEDSAIEKIAEKSFDLKLGARGLKTIFESIMSPILFGLKDLKEKNIIITKNHVENNYKNSKKPLSKAA